MIVCNLYFAFDNEAQLLEWKIPDLEDPGIARPDTSRELAGRICKCCVRLWMLCAFQRRVRRIVRNMRKTRTVVPVGVNAGETG